ncbi:DUF4349 domain-containing protein [Planomonospora venezuelensis]|uniref:DUF4349 domain-containing protein n=1 Tax=Planomonospora venezuelensis TaxID=1999 RepID=A0A841DAC1_PLAVE|nr:DUF4349 domain-containing protein [Planomonospora venezuelensis]MBB5964326.1 hypothetical protein [Planomonospora venezuelensis]GIM98521.1 lipoprotein [Planomonospora venezuelensis]
MNRFRYGPRLAVPLVCLAMFASACAGSESATSSDAAAPVPQASRAPAEPRSGEKYGAGGDTAAAEEAPGSAAAGQAERVEAVPTDRAIVYTAQMTVRAKDVAAASDKAKEIVTAAGGYLAQERSDAFDGGEASSTLVFKIPPSGYPGILGRLGRELGKRESIQQSTEDVTEEVADVESRLKSAQSALESLRTLLKRANTIGEVLKIERDVADREAELESLQARQRKLASLSSMATLTLNIVGPAAEVPQPPKEDPGGFLSGLKAGWEAFVTAVRIGLTVLGALLPWLLVIVPVWLAISFVLRRGRRNRPAGPGLPPGAPPYPGPTAPPPAGTAAAEADEGDEADGRPVQEAGAGPRSAP